MNYEERINDCIVDAESSGQMNRWIGVLCYRVDWVIQNVYALLAKYFSLKVGMTALWKRYHLYFSPT